MFLKNLTINGFKSFCEPSEIKFDKGISAIVGPNGCGKSNIVDALKWVLGEQKNRSLRANNMTDVIFKGTTEKKGLGRAEVRLTLVNENGLLPLDFNEVEVARIIYADGENEYYINKEKVRLKDIHELFFDTGVGKSAYSFMEQGKIDMILSNKPEDRRYIIEEAAGITKYKSRKNEAENNLNRANENIVRAQDIFSEVSKQYESMKKQADKAQRYMELKDNVRDLEIELGINRLMLQKNIKDRFSGKQSKVDEELAAIQQEIDSLENDVSEKMLKVNNLEQEKIDKHREIERTDGEIKALNVKNSALRDKEATISASLRADEEKLGRLDKTIADTDEELAAVDDERFETVSKINSIEKDISRHNDMISQIDIDLKKNEEQIRTLHGLIKDLAAEQAGKRGHLKEITDALIVKIEESLNVFDMNSREIMTLKESVGNDIPRVREEFRTRRQFLEDVLKIRNIPSDSSTFFQQLEDFGKHLQELENKLGLAGENVNKYVKATEIFMNDIFSPEGIIQRKRKTEHEIAELDKRMHNCRTEIENLEKNSEVKEEQKENYRKLVEEAKVIYSTLLEKQKSFDREIQRITKIKNEYIAQKAEIERTIKSRNDELEDVQYEIDENDGLLRKERSNKKKIEDRINELENLIQTESEKMSQQQLRMRSINESFLRKKSEIEELKLKLAEVDTTINEIYRNAYDNLSINLKEYENTEKYNTGRESSVIRESLSNIKSSMMSLGQVNMAAMQECESLKERYDLLLSQLEDLQKGKEDLLTIINELNGKSQEMFEKTYVEIRKNFQMIFSKLFNGGKADILLTDPENLLETGIDVEVQPPGQTRKSITLLSGGQRTMTAIALMFATFMVKPSPFCLLDEIDAALDEANVTRFIELVQDFKDQSQFVMITHNKKTMSAANVMYGVTQETMGVSKIVSAKFIEKIL
ncbi:MAG: AAA family ATPase [Spirochaetales bacterium]|nr:AAA family ATPase [Spirochaetales bacterium]